MSANFGASFCVDPLWNSSLSWDTPNPSLTRCFRKTVCLWAPMSVLFLLGVPQLILQLWRRCNRELVSYHAVTSPNDVSVYSKWLLASKCLLHAFIVALALLELFFQSSADEGRVAGVDYLYCLLLCSGCLLSAALVLLACLDGDAGAGGIADVVQFCTWLMMTLFYLPELKSALDGADLGRAGAARVLLFVCFLGMLALQFFESSPGTTTSEETASVPSTLWFSWLNPLLRKGFGKDITVEEFPEIRNSAQLESINSRFSDQLARRLQTGDRTRVLPVLFGAFAPELAVGAVFKLLDDVLQFVSPQVLRRLIRVLDGEDYAWKGYFFATLLFLTCLTTVTCFHVYHRKMYTAGLQMRTAVVATVYRKGLRAASLGQGKFGSGEITNLMAVDAHRLLMLMMDLHVLWSGPLKLVLAAYFFIVQVHLHKDVGGDKNPRVKILRQKS